MITVWYDIYIFFVGIVVLYVNCEYPYPVHFEVNINEETSPFLFEFEGTKLIIINDETYELNQDNQNPLQYSLSPLSNELFRNVAQMKKTSHSYYRYLSGNYVSYIFPFANNKIVYLYKDAQSFIESIDEEIEAIVFVSNMSNDLGKISKVDFSAGLNEANISEVKDILTNLDNLKSEMSLKLYTSFDSIGIE